MKNRRQYCQSNIESFGRSRCKIQCDHCKKYYAPLEKRLRVPRKLKKKRNGTNKL